MDDVDLEVVMQRLHGVDAVTFMGKVGSTCDFLVAWPSRGYKRV